MNYAFPARPRRHPGRHVEQPVSGAPHFLRRAATIPTTRAKWAPTPRAMSPSSFMKPPGAILHNNSVLPYPPGTDDLQPEVELVVALHKGGKNIPVDSVDYDYVFGYAVGLDMTRRDAASDAAREKGRPGTWPRHSTIPRPARAITPEFYAGNIASGKIELKVNGEIRQSGDVGDMIWKIPQMVHYPVDPASSCFPAT